MDGTKLTKAISVLELLMDEKAIDVLDTLRAGPMSEPELMQSTNYPCSMKLNIYLLKEHDLIKTGEVLEVNEDKLRQITKAINTFHANSCV